MCPRPTAGHPSGRLRVLIFYDCVYPHSLGGVEHRNHELARRLGQRGHEVVLAGFSPEEGEPFPNVRVVSLGVPGRLYDEAQVRSRWQAMRLLWGALRVPLGRYDVVEAANIPYAHLGPLAWRCRRARVPFVVSWYEYWGSYWKQYLRSPAWPLYAAIERASVNLGTAAIACSELTASRLQRGRRGAVPVVRIGVDCALVRRHAAEASPGAAPPLVYAGRLIREKRIDLLLDAVALLAPGRPGVLLAVIGDGPDRPRLEALAAQRGLAASVSFTGRFTHNADVWRRLGGARIAVQPSAREGYGLFPLEAMAAGLPVVYCASGESAVGEIVEHGQQGLRAAGEPRALADALARLLDGEEERSRLAGNARAHAQGFDWSAVAARMEDVYRAAIGGRSYFAALSQWTPNE